MGTGGEGMAGMARIFVSSTFGDLQECRAAVRLALRRLRQDDVAMEYYVADSERPVDRCLRDVRESDLYVGVFAWRYGYVPAGQDRSITELEYRAAVDAGKDRLVFLLRDEAPWPRASMDTGEGGVRIEALRAELAGEHVCSFFSGPEDLGSAVTAAVSNWLQAQGQHAAGDGVLPAATLAVYRQRLEQQYGRLDLDALTPPQREEYLQISLRAVFLEPGVREDPPPVELPKEIWAKLQATGELTAADLPSGVDPGDLIRARDLYRAKPVRPALSVVADAAGQHVVLLGDPGSGKSTLARYLTLALAAGGGGGEDALQRLDGYLPLLVELRSYVQMQDQATFLEFVDHLARTEKLGLEREPLDRYLRHDGRTLVIFDGLDEVFDPRRRDAVARQIAGFAAEYPKVRVIVTSRTIGYRRATLTNARFAHYTLQDLDEEQVEEFLRRWYSLALHDQAQAGDHRQAPGAAAGAVGGLRPRRRGPGGALGRQPAPARQPRGCRLHRQGRQEGPAAPGRPPDAGGCGRAGRQQPAGGGPGRRVRELPGRPLPTRPGLGEDDCRGDDRPAAGAELHPEPIRRRGVWLRTPRLPGVLLCEPLRMAVREGPGAVDRAVGGGLPPPSRGRDMAGGAAADHRHRRRPLRRPARRGRRHRRPCCWRVRQRANPLAAAGNPVPVRDPQPPRRIRTSRPGPSYPDHAAGGCRRQPGHRTRHGVGGGANSGRGGDRSGLAWTRGVLGVVRTQGPAPRLVADLAGRLPHRGLAAARRRRRAAGADRPRAPRTGLAAARGRCGRRQHRLAGPPTDAAAAARQGRW